MLTDVPRAGVTVEGVVEAVRNDKDLDECTSTKRKNRACEPGRYAVVPSHVSDAENCQKGKNVPGSRSLSEKEEKIPMVAEVCGTELPNPDRSMNYSSGSFLSCGIAWCREELLGAFCVVCFLRVQIPEIVYTSSNDWGKDAPKFLRHTLPASDMLRETFQP